MTKSINEVNSKISNSLKETATEFLDALKKVKSAGMETEFQAISAHFNVLKQMISANNEKMNISQNDNTELQRLAQSIIDLTKLEYHALKDKPKQDGLKGGAPIQYKCFYEMVDEVIEKYEGDLSAKGVLIRIARIAERKVGEGVDIPSERQATKVVKEKIENFKCSVSNSN
tara:strand:+ start:1895 stop:2410 length:516 start_codon:yes stop_codon:yes gene_type:complete